MKEISLNDLQKAALAIVKVIQSSEYQEEISAIQTVGHVSNSSSLKSLCPILHEGILRVGGRSTHAAIFFDAGHPMIVPKTRWIIHHHHDIMAHFGQEHVLSKIRESSGYLMLCAPLSRPS